MTDIDSYRKKPVKRPAVLVIFALFCFSILFFLCGEDMLDGGYMLYLASRISVLSIVTMGCVFVFTVEAFCVILGASALLGISVGALLYSITQNIFLCAAACILLPIFACVLSSLLSTTFKLPVCVTSVLMLGILIALAWLVIEMNGGEIYTGLDIVSRFSSHASRIICFIAYGTLCIILYNITPLGKRQKMLVNNKGLTRLYDVSLSWYSFIGFLIAGLGVGIGSYLILCSRPSVSVSSVGDLGFNVIFTILLGGMIFDEGVQANLSSVVIGSISAVFLDEIIFHVFSKSNVYTAYSQIIRALILLIFMAAWRRFDRAKIRFSGD